MGRDRRYYFRDMEIFETGAMTQQGPEMDRYRELRARKLELEDTLKKVVPIRPPPYLYTQANIERFQQSLKELFLSGDNSMTRNYLRFLVEGIIVTGE